MHKQSTKNAEDPRLLTVEEARAVLRISRWKLYQLINARRLNTIRIGQRRLIAADDLSAFLDNLRREGAHHHGG